MYNKTTTEDLPNIIRLQCLRMCIMQDKALYSAYTSYLSANSASGNLTWTPTYKDFYENLKINADVHNSGNAARLKANMTFLHLFDDDNDVA